MNEDKATRYHRRRRRAGLAAAALAGVVLGVLAISGAALRVREVAAIVGEALPMVEGDAATVPVFAALLFALLFLVDLPFAFYQGWLLERRYGLSTEPARLWLADHAKAGLLSGLLGVVGASVTYAALRRWPEWWWAATALLGAGVLVGLAHLAPVLLLPLFHRVRPLDRPGLDARLLALADRVGARVAGVYEWQLGGHTRKANAALAGLGCTRRILLSDTLLANYSDEEIEVVVAHELAHHLHHDLWRGLALQTAVLAGALFAAHHALAALAGPLGLAGTADPAGLPLLLLVVGAWGAIGTPVLNAASRAQERRADRFALDATRNAPAFVSAMRRLAQQNLAEEDPPPVVRWLFHSHPPTRSRLDAARAWTAGR